MTSGRVDAVQIWFDRHCQDDRRDRGSTEPFRARLHAGYRHETLGGVKVVAVRREGHVLGGEPTGIMR